MEHQSLLAQPQQSSALTQIEGSRAVQEVQAALIIAKRFPRDEKAALDRILNACTRPGLANAAVYQYARGETNITGPSIRLAEAIAQHWGNIQFGIRELEQSNGESTVEAFAWDIETNSRSTKTFQVPHTRYTKAGGNRKLNDPRDIYELVANNGARRLRSCILAVIPGDIVESAVNQCETTMAADADTSPEAQKKIVDTFAKWSVTKDQIEARIQRRLDSITPAQVVALRKIVASLKDGMSKPEEWFAAAVPAAKVEPAAAKPGAKKTAPGEKNPEPPAPDFELDATPPPQDFIADMFKRGLEAGFGDDDVTSAVRFVGISPDAEWPADITNEQACEALADWAAKVLPALKKIQKP